MNSRLCASKILIDVIVKHRSLTESLELHGEKLEKPEDHALVKAMCFGVLRWYFKLECIANELLDKPMNKKDRDIFCLLLLGIYQISDMRIPSHAAVNETVNIAKRLKKPWATGLLNKLLRMFAQTPEKYINIADKDLSSKFSHPEWLIKKIKHEHPSDWESILSENNVQAPLFLRANIRKNTVDEFISFLSQKGITAASIPEFPQAVFLEHALPVEAIPGFLEGRFCVQDLSGQDVVPLLMLEPGLRVLDACAAPGSKTSHMLEIEPSLERLVAVDNNAKRLQKIKDNITRLQLPRNAIGLTLADASHVKEWWDGALFDRILLDAPCSATGVIRRHPDIKTLRQPDDIQALHEQQLHFLKTLWPLLKKDGLLIYSTCSILKEENEQVIEKFLKTEPTAKLLSSKQRLPQRDGPDGFYYAVLTN